MMNIAVCSVEAKNAATIEESPFPNKFPKLIIPFKGGFLFVSAAKLYFYDPNESEEATVIFRDSVTSLASSDTGLFIVSGNRLLRSDLETPLNFTLMPIPCRANDPLDIVQVACGQNHVLVLTKTGDVFAQGRGAACGLGLEGDAEETEFTKIQGISDVFFIAAGNWHSVFVRYKSDSLRGSGRIRPMRYRGSMISPARHQIDESFVRGVVMMSRDGPRVQRGAPAVVDENPLADLDTKRKIESQVWVCGRGVGLGLGQNCEDHNQPTLLPEVDSVVQLACGAQHTVALTATGQVFVWGEYFPGRTEFKPSGIQLSANQYVIEVAAGTNITMACAYIQRWPEIYVIDENKCWQRRQAVLATSDSTRLYQGLACGRSDPAGRVLVVKLPEPEPILQERTAMHNLNFNVLIQVRHLHLLRQQFALKWKISTEHLAKESNVIKFFTDLLDSTLKIVDLGHRLSWHLSKETCLLSSLVQESELPQLLREFYNISNYFRSLFNDLLAFSGFQSVYEKHKKEMIGVIEGMLGNKIRRTEESQVPNYLIHEFEKGVSMFEDLTTWATLKQSDNEELTAVIDELEKKDEVLLSDMAGAMESVEKVIRYLSVVRNDFFAPRRRIQMVSIEKHIQFSTTNNLFRRVKVIVLTGEDFVILANDKLYTWNYQAVWLENCSEEDLTVDVILPELRGTLTATSLDDLQQWVQLITQGIRQRFAVSSVQEDIDCLPNRSFEHKFLLSEKMNDRYIGSWEKGRMHGNGHYEATKKEGKELVKVIYDGGYNFGKRCGYGKLTKEWPDGRTEIVFGAWQDDQLHGYANEIHTRGKSTLESSEEDDTTMRYEGCFVRGKRHGLGRVETFDGGQKSVFLGNWNSGVRCGYGIQTSGDRAFFGEFREDRKTEMGYEINYATGDIVSTTWINGSNFRYNRRGRKKDELSYRIGGYEVKLIGEIAREPNQGKWVVKEGEFSVEVARDDLRLIGDDDESVTKKWGALVENCKTSLLGDPAADNPWKDYLPSKLHQKPESTCDNSDTSDDSSLQAHCERFAALYVEGCSAESMEEDWRKIKDFSVLIRDHYPSFPLAFFLKWRTEVFSFFMGVNNRDRLENLVLQELEELVHDTYALLHCLFPFLPNDARKRATSDPRSSGYDLVHAILPLEFYKKLINICGAFTSAAKSQFLKFCDTQMTDEEFLEHECAFPRQSYKLVQGILDDIALKSPARSLTDINVSALPCDPSLGTEVHISDIIEKMANTFSTNEIITGEKAFEMSDILKEIYESSSQFIRRVHGNFGADEMNPFLLFILWKARPCNFDLHLFVVRHLTKHYRHYQPDGMWDYVQTTFEVVFGAMRPKTQPV